MATTVPATPDPADAAPPRRAVIASAFFPRGGSAHVIRGLARALPDHGWATAVVSGSAAGAGDAERFYAGLDVHPVDLATAGLLASFEDRPGAPDAVFAALDEAAAERHAATWAQALERAGARDADLLHLNHLTPLHAAAARIAPRTPVVTHLHGTELLMLERIDAGAPASWTHAAAWATRMRTWARAATLTVVPAARQVERARRLLGLPAGRVVAVPNGTDLARFARADAPTDRRAFWRRHLVERPRGWRPGGEEGSVAYAEADLTAIDGGGPLLLYVGRFTEVKRIGLLIRAFAAAQRRTRARPALVLVGGHPGEWEGEHPLEAIADSGARDVFLAGWQDQEELPAFLAAGDAIVLPSVREQFGQVLVEGMACGLPAVAADALGPAEIVRDGETGWLIAPDDREALEAALVEVVDDAAERRRRGAAAHADVVRRFGRDAAAARIAATYAAACGGHAVPSGTPAAVSG
ncbi:glycosyltransferase family 4 protein [Conexibacter arvalis]|uniref:Glycosyltransferase involved in cell wall biosynthesis n=1 Tax=Conexibacter arvalis TaxID=912552 RepID=A0A840IDW2_9ACTN|nr:glycosyltransferase family 4 protein [Conexibacter arvalis]MBB4662535.1 glycosyltransferase involved in cell wall biosynthesis [Conexibacter arvalis]